MNKVYRDILPKQFVPFPKADMEGSILDRFRKIVSGHGAKVAIKHGGRITTYEMLDQRSSALAALLVTRTGLIKEPVAMMFKHGTSCHIAQFAVLKSGNFYAHLDDELPLERLVLLLNDLEARVLLVDDACAARAGLLAAAFGGLLVINVEQLDPVPAVLPPEINISPKDYAHIVYTSGSTGPPQGVIVSHENVLQAVHHNTNYTHVSSDDRATQLCPLWTGASASEIFGTLLNGATLLPYSVNGSGLVRLAELLIEERVTSFTAVPTLFRLLMRVVPSATKFPDMRLLRLAGDRTTRVDVELFRQHFMQHCLLRLSIGASEVTVFAHFFIDTGYEMQGEVAPLGYPLEGFELLLLDDDLNEIKGAGQCGEIAVRSEYLSVGYWKNPALTSERFLEDGSGGNTRIYLSRDIAYRDAEGRLHHAGRKDARVKIYGKMYLISDVEQALLGIAGITEAVVVPFDSGERGTELAAYVVTDTGKGDVSAIRRQLAEKIAAEIRPRTITILASMPLHTNNKINRLQLKDMARIA